MNEKERDAWLDKLAEKQKELELELREAEARLRALAPQLGGGNPEEAERFRSAPRFEAYLREKAAEAEAAGRARAEKTRRELNEARGAARNPGRRRQGVVRL
jgi:hypothetical protein